MENIIEILKKNVGTKLTTGDAYSGGENIFFTKAEAFKNTADDLGIKTLIFDAQSLYFEWNDHYFRLESPGQIDVFVRDYCENFQYRGDLTESKFTKEYLESFRLNSSLGQEQKTKVADALRLLEKSIVDLEDKIGLETSLDKLTAKKRYFPVLFFSGSMLGALAVNIGVSYLLSQC